MNARPAVWFIALICALLVLPALAQETASPEELLRKRASETVTTLRPLLDTRDTLRRQIDETAQALDRAAEADKESLAETIDDLKQEMVETEDQISVLATGISERTYDDREPVGFDLQAEVQSLVEPFVVMMKDATESARKIEATRRALADATTRRDTASRALVTLEAVEAATDDPQILEELTQRRELWQNRVNTTSNQVTALNQQLEDLLSERISAGGQVQSAVKSFFRERGLSLLLGVLAFVGVMALCRLIARLIGQLARRRRIKRNFQTRLASLIFSLFTIAASFAALLIVFNLRNDWLLLGLAALLLVALVWIGIRMLPGLIEQVTLLLNLGAVQEDERVVFDGVPYRVAKLDFYTDLVNPALDGGTFTVPVRQLIGLHSRPEAEQEAWFPSQKNDWVKLADGNAGQVIAQTPEMVVVELPGSARVTYQTSDYLA
ncbi:MAG: hypothetical protein AAGF44_05770, partial [Pseudomonadota bacterium]